MSLPFKDAGFPDILPYVLLNPPVPYIFIYIFLN